MILGSIARKYLNAFGIMAAFGMLAGPLPASAATPASSVAGMTAEENAADPTVSNVEAAEGTNG